MVDVYRSVALLVLGSLILAVAPPAAGVDGFDDSVATAWPIEVSGLTTTESGAGALLAEDPAAVTASRIRAEDVVIRHAWEKGVDVRDDESAARVVDDRGSETVRLQEPTVEFSSPRATSALLAYSEVGTVRYTSESAEGATVAPAQDLRVAGYGTASDSVNAADAPDLGFWYQLEGPSLVTQTPGTVSVTGDFTLFVHDVVINAEGVEGAWSDWTGYREEDPDAPVTRFEFRITVLEVKNGTLALSSSEPVSLYSEGLEMDFEGRATSQAVSGQIRSGGMVHLFDADPLRLEGSGTSSFLVGDGGEVVRMAPEGLFEVQGASMISKASGADRAAAPGIAWASVVGLTVVGALALMFLGVVPGPTPRSRQRRHTRWMHEGQTAEVAGDWPRAASCYRRATRIRRDDPLAWFQWASCELEKGDPMAAERVAGQAAEVLGVDAADLLDLRAVAAWERGDREAFEGFVRDLGALSPAMVRGLLLDLGLDPSSFDARLARSRGAVAGDGGIDGYA